MGIFKSQCGKEICKGGNDYDEQQEVVPKFTVRTRKHQTLGSHGLDYLQEGSSEDETARAIPSVSRVGQGNSTFNDNGKNKRRANDYYITSSRGSDLTSQSSSKSLQCLKHRKTSKRHNLINYSTSPLPISSSTSATASGMVCSTMQKSDAKSTQNSTFTLQSNKLKKQLLTNNTQASTIVGNFRSIVGLRPSHWNRDSRSEHRRSSIGTKARTAHEPAKALILAVATKISFKRPNKPKEHVINNLKSAGAPVDKYMYAHSDSPSIRSNNVEKAPFEEAKALGEAMKSSFSFAPLFAPTKSTVVLDDAIGEDDSEDDCRVITASADNSFASETPFKRRRRSKVVTGDLTRRFAMLRSTRSKNSMRLQNKTFARQKMLLDISNPRKYARTYIDVTIVGQYSGPWINIPENMKITVLGYAHLHTKRIEKCPDNAKHTQYHGKKDESMVSSDFFAWFTFTIATARRIDLGKGCKLRIYDAVILPCREVLLLDMPSSTLCYLNRKAEDSPSYHNLCEKTVICTDLCERLT